MKRSVWRSVLHSFLNIFKMWFYLIGGHSFILTRITIKLLKHRVRWHITPAKGNGMLSVGLSPNTVCPDPEIGSGHFAVLSLRPGLRFGAVVLGEGSGPVKYRSHCWAATWGREKAGAELRPGFPLPPSLICCHLHATVRSMGPGMCSGSSRTSKPELLLCCSTTIAVSVCSHHLCVLPWAWECTETVAAKQRRGNLSHLTQQLPPSCILPWEVGTVSLQGSLCPAWRAYGMGPRRGGERVLIHHSLSSLVIRAASLLCKPRMPG